MKLFKKQTKQQAPLTDAELQQATGGMTAGTRALCNTYSDETTCKANHCRWKETSKDNHDCSF